MDRRLVIAFLLAATLSAPAAAKDEIAVIVAQQAGDLPLDVAALRNIYLKKIFVDPRGREYIPLNLPPGHALRALFSATLFNKSAQAMQDYWNQRYFQGIAPPFVLNSQRAVMQFVAKTPGAIGYVANCHLDARVKPLLLLSVPGSEHDTVAALCADNAREATSTD